MNLYEYSEINNREMGVLFHRNDLENTFNSSADDVQIFNDAIQEIRDIINGASLEKESRETIELGFEMNIIKTEIELALESCKKLTKAFIHKKFEPIQYGNSYLPICKNYFDKIDIIFNRRIEIALNYSENKLQDIHRQFSLKYNEFMITDFKIYWNHYKAQIYLYPNSKSNCWNNISEKDEIKLYKNGIDETIVLLRTFI